MVVFLILFIIFILISQHFIYKYNWNKNLTLVVTVDHKQVFENDTILITETITNKKIIPLPLVEITFFTRAFMPVSNNTDWGTVIVSMNAYQRVSVTIRYRCVKRGYYKLKGFAVSGCNVLMADWHTLCYDTNASVTVYPRLITAQAVDVICQKLTGEIMSKRAYIADPFAFRGIREYQPHDSLRDINFKATARTGFIMTNIYEHIVEQDVCIILNLSEYKGYADSVLSEDMIRLAAFFSRFFIEDGIPTALVSNGRDIETGNDTYIESSTSQTHLLNIYDALARIDLGLNPNSIVDTLHLYEPSRNRMYLLISRGDDADVQAWFNTIRDYGGFWIVPFRTGDNTVKIKFDEQMAGYEVKEENE